MLKYVLMHFRGKVFYLTSKLVVLYISKMQTMLGIRRDWPGRGVGVQTPAKFISWDACSIKKISNKLIVFKIYIRMPCQTHQ